MILSVKKLVIKKGAKRSIEIISGGNTRRSSSFLALSYLRNNGTFLCPRYVVFHDAARPLVSIEMLDAVINAALKYGTAAVGIKAIDTVSLVKDSFIKTSLDQSGALYTYTPHCYRFDWIYRAHKLAQSDEGEENMTLLLKTGKKARIIDGFYPNFKLTYNADIKVIEQLLKNGKRK